MVSSCELQDKKQYRVYSIEWRKDKERKEKKYKKRGQATF